MVRKLNFWRALALFLLGFVLGVFFSPVKKGVFCGNYNGNRKQPYGMEAAERFFE